MQLKLFFIKRENIQVTVKSRVKLKETAKLTIDLALLWIQNRSKAACKVSLDQNPANHNSQSEVNIKNQWEIQLKQRQLWTTMRTTGSTSNCVIQ